MNRTKKVVLSSMFVAIAVLGSFFHIPVGLIKVSPVQHAVNLIAGVILGPAYATIAAFVASLIRLLTGLGSPLAFPGSMIGAFLCGLIFNKTKSKLAAYFGEIIGTGFLGAYVSIRIAKVFLGQELALLVVIPSFFLSALVGASISLVLLKVVDRD
jgi:energy coupling factor transporter S component ThiW